MEEYKKNLVEFASNLVFEYKENPSVFPYTPSKIRVCKEEPPTLKRARPEACGVESARIVRLYERLEADAHANVHSIVIARHGKIIAEASRPGFSARLPHLSHSMSKSVTGILIMLLWDDGKLDTGDLITSYFPELTPKSREFSSLTVEHLLTMSSGVGFGEVGVVCEEEWTRAYFDSDMVFSPGEKFAYNSMNSYVLAHLADRICKKEYGVSAESFLYDRLFAPLGIEKPLWELSPEGIIKGGFGLYLSAESWTKIGIMMLNRGMFDGRLILSPDAVVHMTSAQSVTMKSTGDFNYGMHVWVCRDGDDFLFNGMFGQNVWVSPRSDTVVAMSAGNNELFSKGAALSIVRETFTNLSNNVTRPSHKASRELEERTRSFFLSRRWITPKKPLRGLPYFLGIRTGTPFNTLFSALLGEYTFPSNNHGIFPVFVRAMQNNFQGGIRSFTFERAGELLRLRSLEGETPIVIDFGFYEPVTSLLSLSGEQYLVSAIADAVEEANGNIVYKLELIFPELPNTRRITLTLSPLGRLYVGMREIPDERIADAIVEAIPTMSGKAGFLYGFLERNLGKNFIENKVKELFAPEFCAISKKAPDYDAALAEQNEKVSEKIASSRLVRSLVFSFLGNEEKKAEDSGGALGKLAGFFGKFF